MIMHQNSKLKSNFSTYIKLTINQCIYACIKLSRWYSLAINKSSSALHRNLRFYVSSKLNLIWSNNLKNINDWSWTKV